MLTDLYIGIMSGTSLDGADAVLADFSGPAPTAVDHSHIPFPAALRDELESLSTSGTDEIHRSQIAALQLVRCYASCVSALLERHGLTPADIAAIGCHGQTVRHVPKLGYSVQINAPAALAEQSGICVVSDFRSRDIAAGGQGAPLVPAFHAAVFGSDVVRRAVLNLGGMANLTLIASQEPVRGFDCGPANVLMDAWIRNKRGKRFDREGMWAASGKVDQDLLDRLLSHPFFALKPPKSCGREQFNETWLYEQLTLQADPADVQATLAELTATSVAEALESSAFQASEVIVCGGGARNTHLLGRLAAHTGLEVRTSDALGVPPEQVEAFAFAWLASRTMSGQSGNLPVVTGAAGPRVLGAIWPA